MEKPNEGADVPDATQIEDGLGYLWSFSTFVYDHRQRPREHGGTEMKGREKKGKLRATYLTIPSMRILNSRLIEGSVAGLSNAV